MSLTHVSKLIRYTTRYTIVRWRATKLLLVEKKTEGYRAFVVSILFFIRICIMKKLSRRFFSNFFSGDKKYDV